MREIFVSKNFTDGSLQIIAWIIDVLDKYRAKGYDLTVRQVYYQLVAQDLIPNNLRSYNKIQRLISEGRKAGLVDWGMIVDRTRGTRIPAHWESPADIIRSSAESYAIDKWEDQPNHIEIMCEKEALAGILAPECSELDVNFTSNRGYSSDSLMYRVAKRALRKKVREKEIFILYFGDHDPSGLDMDRDILDRVSMFSRAGLTLKRLALLMDQVEEMDLPENPAKTTDSRYEGYLVRFGDASWELDAVQPEELTRLLHSAVTSLRDDDLWDAAVKKEEEGRAVLEDFADEYEEREDEDF